jgi:rhodanese-related sulfurtransferase
MFFRSKNTVDVRTAQEMAGTGDYVLVDVRTKRERREGHPPGSMHISLESLQQRTRSLEGRKVLAICRSGNRSGTAAKYLNSMGIEAWNVKGGMIAWNRAGLPTKKGS